MAAAAMLAHYKGALLVLLSTHEKHNSQLFQRRVTPFFPGTTTTGKIGFV
jgi:hypothetical protein